ncbi:MAG TPA: anaerobic ribonucleoside-triphosphate reductase activating protein [Selenomonadales bacterium]|nr:anaerobic ribonucleoside-triphosphate reductase activating protein [Selenomonadales bacterium]
MEFRIAGITKESVVDGPGIRMVVYAQGCHRNCPDCHNPDTHDRNGGELVDTELILGLVSRARLIRGVTLSGGEPFLQPEPLAHLARQVRARGLDIVTYTGFVFEELLALSLKDKAVRDLLTVTDILIDGAYRAEERDLSLAFRGSRNQRIINVPKSLATGQVVPWGDEPYCDIRRRA